MNRKPSVKLTTKAIRKIPAMGGWHALPKTGFRVHRVDEAACRDYGWNEVWARIGERGDDNFEEFRGTAEKVAEQIVAYLLKQLTKSPPVSDKVGAELQARL